MLQGLLVSINGDPFHGIMHKGWRVFCSQSKWRTLEIIFVSTYCHNLSAHVTKWIWCPSSQQSLCGTLSMTFQSSMRVSRISNEFPCFLRSRYKLGLDYATAAWRLLPSNPRMLKTARFLRGLFLRKQKMLPAAFQVRSVFLDLKFPFFLIGTPVVCTCVLYHLPMHTTASSVSTPWGPNWSFWGE